jgi:hypothetical protein
MKSTGNASGLHWRRLCEDLLIGAAALVVALAAIGTASYILYLLLIAGALSGVGAVLELNVTAQPTGDSNPQPLRLTM